MKKSSSKVAKKNGKKIPKSSKKIEKKEKPDKIGLLRAEIIKSVVEKMGTMEEVDLEKVSHTVEKIMKKLRKEKKKGRDSKKDVSNDVDEKDTVKKEDDKVISEKEKEHIEDIPLDTKKGKKKKISKMFKKAISNEDVEIKEIEKEKKVDTSASDDSNDDMIEESIEDSLKESDDPNNSSKVIIEEPTEEEQALEEKESEMELEEKVEDDDYKPLEHFFPHLNKNSNLDDITEGNEFFEYLRKYSQAGKGTKKTKREDSSNLKTISTLIQLSNYTPMGKAEDLEGTLEKPFLDAICSGDEYVPLLTSVQSKVINNTLNFEAKWKYMVLNEDIHLGARVGYVIAILKLILSKFTSQDRKGPSVVILSQSAQHYHQIYSLVSSMANKISTHLGKHIKVLGLKESLYEKNVDYNQLAKSYNESDIVVAHDEYLIKCSEISTGIDDYSMSSVRYLVLDYFNDNEKLEKLKHYADVKAAKKTIILHHNFITPIMSITKTLGIKKKLLFVDLDLSENTIFAYKSIYRPYSMFATLLGYLSEEINEKKKILVVTPFQSITSVCVSLIGRMISGNEVLMFDGSSLDTTNYYKFNNFKGSILVSCEDHLLSKKLHDIDDIIYVDIPRSASNHEKVLCNIESRNKTTIHFVLGNLEKPALEGHEALLECIARHNGTTNVPEAALKKNDLKNLQNDVISHFMSIPKFGVKHCLIDKSTICVTAKELYYMHYSSFVNDEHLLNEILQLKEMDLNKLAKRKFY